MSLYIGCLSPRIRRDELQRVFQRFGECNVRIKGGFGFVVYDFPPNAEKALRALEGRRICGQSLTLTWSNKQPRGFQRFARSDRSNDYGSVRGQEDAIRGDNVNRKFYSNGERDYKMGFSQAESKERKMSSAELLNEETTYHHGKEYVKGKHHDYHEDLANSGAHTEANQIENDRWNGRLNSLSQGDAVGHDSEYDHYDSYKSYEGKDKDENNRPAYSGGSPDLRNSLERIRRQKMGQETLKPPDGTNSQQSCYSCGGFGHKKRDCPRETVRGRKLARFGRRRDDGYNRRSRDNDRERFRSSSEGKLHSDRDGSSMKQNENHREVSGSEKSRKSIGGGGSLGKEKAVRSSRDDNRGKRRGGRGSGTPTRQNTKRARRLGSSPSDDTASISHSKAKSFKREKRSDLRSRSRSVSSRLHSGSSVSRSQSPPRCSRSKSSESSLKSLTPVSIGKPSPSSPNKVQLNEEGNLDASIPTESKEIMFEGTPVCNEEVENTKLEQRLTAVDNQNVSSPAKVQGEVKTNGFNPGDNDDNNVTSKSMNEFASPGVSLSEKGVHASGIKSLVCQKETRGSEDSDTATQKPDTDLPVSFRSCQSTSISSEEMCMVLKHYGLKLPDDNEKHLPVETYFGAARLWPWEIIYYRRLKKGPVSIENYAKRVAQNQEHGIVDKYIRSSSGWGEVSHP